MIIRTSVEAFLSQRVLAVAGVSRLRKKTGFAIYNALRHHGYIVYPVNKNSDGYYADLVFPNLNMLPKPVNGIVTVVPPEETEEIVREAADLGIMNIWMQIGSESDAAINVCIEKGMNLVTGKCILLFLKENGIICTAHRWILEKSGRLYEPEHS